MLLKIQLVAIFTHSKVLLLSFLIFVFAW